MIEPTKYDEIERDLYHSPLPEVIEQQNEMYEFMLTVIVLALTLNLVSNVIWSLQETLAWSIIVFVLSVLSTIAVLLTIAKRRFSRVSTLMRNIHVTVAWDPKNQEFPELPYLVGYGPQTRLHKAVKRLETDQKQQLGELISNMPPSYFAEKNPVPHRIILDMIYRILLNLRNIQGRLPGIARHIDIQGEHLDQVIYFTECDEPIMILPGTFQVSVASGEFNAKKLVIKWNGSWRGKLIMDISCRTSTGDAPRVIDGLTHGPTIIGLHSSESIDESDFIILDYDIAITASFNPYILAFNRYCSRELFDWMKDVIDYLWKMDYGYAFYRAERKRKQES